MPEYERVKAEVAPTPKIPALQIQVEPPDLALYDGLIEREEGRTIFGPFIGPRRYLSERFGVSGRRRPREIVGSADEPWRFYPPGPTGLLARGRVSDSVARTGR